MNLREGSAAEIAATDPVDLSPLYEGGHDDAIAGIVSIDGALDGTTLVDAMGYTLFGLLKMVVITTELLVGDELAAGGHGYDFDFGYLGIECSGNTTAIEDCLESYSAYSNPDWNDHSGGVLSLDGARERHMLGAQAYNTTFYVSIAGDATRPSGDRDGAYVPQSYMSPLLTLFGYTMGHYKLDEDAYDEWRPNDGLIPVRGQVCPRLGYDTDYCGTFTTAEDMQPGVWMTIDGWLDHVAVIGWTLNADELEAGRNLFVTIAEIILAMDAKHDAGLDSRSTTPTSAGTGATASPAVATTSAPAPTLAPVIATDTSTATRRLGGVGLRDGVVVVVVLLVATLANAAL